MKKRTVVFIGVVVFLGVTGPANGQAHRTDRRVALPFDDPPIAPGLPTPGPYAVGFRGLLLRDVARPSPADPSEKYGVVAGLWYPALEGTGSALRLSDYLRYRSSRDHLALPSELDDGAGMATFAGAAAFAAGADSLPGIREVAVRSVRAREGAEPLPGPFPVLIGGLAGPEQNGLLGEWLASHGWVVLTASSPALLATTELTDPQVALEHRVRTLELLLRHAPQSAAADPKRVAVVGTNFDGMAALLFQMRTRAASAVVSIDGWEGKRGTRVGLLESPWLDPVALTVPYLLFLQDEEDPRPSLVLDLELFDGFRFSERRALSWEGLTHVPLIVQNLAAVDALRHPAHGHLWEVMRAFLEAAVAGASIPDRLVDADGPPLALHRRSAAASAPPDPLRIEWLLRNGREADAIAAYQRALPHLDGLELMGAATLQRHVRLRFQRGDTATAIALAEIAVREHPTRSDVWHTLGDLHRAAGSATEAARAYEAAIARLPAGDAETRRVLEEKLAELGTGRR